MEPTRARYRIRIGKRWLKSLVCRPGGAVLTDSEADAGLFEGPAQTAGEARLLLRYEKRVWCKPVDGAGFWSF